jgi:hypothetical protein
VLTQGPVRETLVRSSPVGLRAYGTWHFSKARLLFPAAALAAVLAGFSVAAAAETLTAVSTPSFKTDGIVRELVASDGKVALVIHGPRRVKGSGQLCPHVVLWTPKSHSAVPLSTVLCGGWTARSSVFDVALAGARVAWVSSGGGNSYETNLVTRTAREPKAFSLAFGNGFVGNARGDGAVLVFNSYARCARDEGMVCPVGVADGSIFNASVWRYLGGSGGERCPTILGDRHGCKFLAKSPQGELSVLALGGGRIAVKTQTGTVRLLSSSTGATLAEHSYAPGVVRAAALDSKNLVVLRAGFLDVYTIGSTAAPHSWKLPRAASYGSPSPPPEIRGSGPPRSTPSLTLEDVGAGFAVYVFDRAVRIVRLTDGRDALLTRPAVGPVHAQLVTNGVYVSARNRVTFTAIGVVRRRFR